MPKGIPKNGINTGWFKKGQNPYNKGTKRPEMSGKNSPTWKGGEVKLHCILCGKEYYKERCQVYRSKFCSRACRAKYMFTGAKNRLWKNGVTKEREKLRKSELYKKWRLKVFQRDRFTCKLCGYRGCKSKAHGDKTSDIHAHHIITLDENIRLCLKAGNGITLCVKHHHLTYGKEKNFTKVFKEILRDFTLIKTKV